MNQQPADVCLILEGSYPYVAGGVSSWAHDLIQTQAQLSFHLLILLAPGAEKISKYTLPSNVIGKTEIILQCPPKGKKRISNTQGVIEKLEPALTRLMHNGDFTDLKDLLDVLNGKKNVVGKRFLLDSHECWEMLLRMYQQDFNHCSFLDYFWTWRGLLGGLYSVLLGELPQAKVYHSISTGYAGLCLARAKIETGRPALLTEHGIYTNERRIEIAMADWLHEEKGLRGMSIERNHRNLRDLWMHSFQSYSRACYQASDRIITLFEGNQSFQLNDGALIERMQVIPNGVDYARFAGIQKQQSTKQLRVALIGRVVPIKDVKTYIRAIAMARKTLPQIKGYLLGPYDEDPEYYSECQYLVEHLALGENFEFTGRVNLQEWMGNIDLIVLTSISEGQPLVILEAGAAGVPCIATDVGACREMIEGSSQESPNLGKGGEVVPLSNPSATAKAMVDLLSDPQRLQQSGEAIKKRVATYYNREDLKQTYRNLYHHYSQSSKEQHSIEAVC